MGKISSIEYDDESERVLAYYTKKRVNGGRNRWVNEAIHEKAARMPPIVQEPAKAPENAQEGAKQAVEASKPQEAAKPDQEGADS